MKNIEKKNFLLSRKKKSTREIANFSKIIFCLLNEDLFCENVHIVNFHLYISVASTLECEESFCKALKALTNCDCKKPFLVDKNFKN